MKISELKAGMRKVELTAKVDELGDERTVNLKSGGTNTVRDAVLSDESGTVKLTLWGADGEKFRAGDRVMIENGYVNSYKGELSVATGKFGKLKRL